MKPTLPLALALLTSCSIAGADERTAPPEPTSVQSAPFRTWDGLTLEALSRVDVRGTARSIEVIRQDVERLTPRQRAEAAESIRILSVNCPYTRASLQLATALHQRIIDIDIDHIDPIVQKDWEYLWRGLVTHVAVLEALDVDLTLPAPGDHLYQATSASMLVDRSTPYGSGAPMMIDRATLLASADPVQATAPLVEEITRLVDQMDPATQAKIGHHNTHVRDITGHQASLDDQIRGWGSALRHIGPLVSDPDTQAEISALISTLDRFAGQGC